MQTPNMTPTRTSVDISSSSQWIFPAEALKVTPSATSSQIPLEKELYDRARGIEFLYRLGASLQLPTSALFTAATWYHRFYMRFSMEDFHRQDVATACIFLASKTDECGRKLKDVARVCRSKATGVSPDKIPENEIQEYQDIILATEETLLESLCFDFVIESPHETLAYLLERYAHDFTAQSPASSLDPALCDIAWNIAHDSYRTVLCLLHDARIIAAACFVLAQRYVDGEHSLPLDARIAPSAPSASLPTPPTNKPASPDASRMVIEECHFNEAELSDLADVLATLIEFYAAQDTTGAMPHLLAISKIRPPSTSPSRIKLYAPNSHVPATTATKGENQHTNVNSQGTQERGMVTESPSKKAWKPVSSRLVSA